MDLDHVVLWVEDPIAAVEFYVDVVGFCPVRVEEFAAGDAPFPSVRINDATILDLMEKSEAANVSGLTRSNGGGPVNHVCLSMTAAEYPELVDRLLARGVELTPAREGSFGARGLAACSQYFRDPDGNVIEIRHYDGES